MPAGTILWRFRGRACPVPARVFRLTAAFGQTYHAWPRFAHQRVKRLNIKQLQYFLKVLKERSITRAAARLYVAQPALGLQIRKLEQELDVELFVRHSRGVTPTEAALRLAAHAEILVRQFERARQDMLDYAGEPRGRVIVGLPVSTTFVLAGVLARECRERFPKIALNLTVGLSERLMEWVHDERIDMALTYNTAGAGGLAFEPLAGETLYVVHNAARGELPARERFEHVLAHELVLPSAPHLLRTLVDTQASALGCEPRVTFEVDSVPAIKELLRHDLACTILPYAAVQAEVDAGEFRAAPIGEPALERTLYIAFPERRPAAKAFEAVANLLRDTVRDVARRREAGWTPVGEGNRTDKRQRRASVRRAAE